MRRLFMVLFGALGVFGLVANNLEFLLSPPQAPRQLAKHEQPFESGASDAVPEDFVRSLAPPEAVIDFFSQRPRQTDLNWLVRANDVVARALVHAPRALALRENWLLWLGGKAWHPLADTQDADKVLMSRGGICDDAANVLMQQLKRVGVDSRFVTFGGRSGQPLGHALLEVEVENRWLVTDPDYGIVIPASLEELRSTGKQGLISAALEEKGWGTVHAEVYRDIVLHNPVSRSPVGASLGEKLALIQGMADIARWPAALLLIGLAVAMWRAPALRVQATETQLPALRPTLRQRDRSPTSLGGSDRPSSSPPRSLVRRD